MARYLVYRVAGMLPIVIGVTLMVFVVGRLAPGDPVQILFGDISNPVVEARARSSASISRCRCSTCGTSAAWHGWTSGRPTCTAASA
jgi:ABC-type dipeptide/oligopeptide/nickel transport system permease component